jgi:hypothetical protein
MMGLWACADIGTRIKRLLGTDRDLGRNEHSSCSEEKGGGGSHAAMRQVGSR